MRETNKTYNFATPFFERLDKWGKTGNHLAAIYFHAFQCVNIEDLDANLKFCYDDWITDTPNLLKWKRAIKDYKKELRLGVNPKKPQLETNGWFGAFHKQFRQIDFFDNCKMVRRVSLLTTPELRKEHKALLKWYDAYFEKHSKNIEVKYEDIKRMIRDVDEVKFKRFWELQKMSRNLETKSICGHLDMIVYETIDMDVEGVLLYTLNEVFENYLIEKGPAGKKKKLLEFI